MIKLTICILLLYSHAQGQIRVRMGIMLPGENWPTGNDTFIAAKAAIDDINAEGDLLIEYKVEISGCDSKTAFDAAHDLLVEYNAQVIIGPACSVTCEPVAHFAEQYNVPVVSYSCSGTGLSDRAKFPFFARTCESLSGGSKMLTAVFKKYLFELFSVMTTTQNINVNFAIDFITTIRNLKDENRKQEQNAGSDKQEQPVPRDNNTIVSDDPPLEETNYNMKQLSAILSSIQQKDESVQNGTIDQLRTTMNAAWVFFMSMYDGDADFILKHAYKIASEMVDEDEKVWEKANYAWFRYQSYVKEDFRKYYHGVFSLENDKPQNNDLYKNKYLKFLKKLNMTKDDLNMSKGNVAIYLAYSYNSVKAWAAAFKKSYDNHGADGWKAEFIMPYFKNLKYEGSYRSEELNEYYEPKTPIWVVRQFQENRWVDVIKSDPNNISNVEAIESAIIWPNGKPVDPCKDGRCNTGSNNTVLYIVVTICVILVIAAVGVSFFIVQRHKKQSSDDMKVDWKIPFNDLDFSVKKSLSGSRKMLGTVEDSKSSSLQVAKFSHNLVVVKNLNVSTVTITKEILEDLCVLKQMSHPNLNVFYGLCDDPGYCSVITALCSKGSLKDLAHNENVHLDWMFKLSLIIDVAKGLKYLHESSIGYHGNLRTSLCVVDSHWVCKLTDFGLQNLKKSLQAPVNGSGPNTTANPRDLFYKAPEMLWPSSKERTSKEIQKADTYSFAIIMYELFARDEPYDTADMLPEKVINKIRNRESPPYRPNVELLNTTDKTSYELMNEDSPSAIPAESVELMKKCWAELAFERHNICDTVQELEDMNPDRSLSITDRVVKMMEKYSEDLENKVAKKTLQLQNQQASRKLCRFLPKKIIEKIENGMEVENLNGKLISGACIKVHIHDTKDHISTINEYESFNSTEIESRNIYQVIDRDGQPLIVSGLFDEGNSTDTLIDYVKALQRFTSNRLIKLKVVLHAGCIDAGLVMADTSHPRLCITGDFTNDLYTLLDTTNYGQVLLTSEVSSKLSDNSKLSPHIKARLTTGISDTYLMYNKPLQPCSSAPTPVTTNISLGDDDDKRALLDIVDTTTIV